MQSNLLRPKGMTIQASVTKAATYTGTAFEIPLAESYAFIINVTAASGTTPTLDVAYQVTVDEGTTWFTALRHAQITTTSIRRLQVQPSLGKGEAGTEAAIANTGGALNANTILTRKMRTVWTIGGTNPSFTAAQYLLCVSRSAGD